MNISEAFCQQLATSSDITDLIDDRIYPEYTREADKVYPLIVYKIEDVSSLQSHDGATGLISCNANVAIVAETYGEADGLSAIVQLFLDATKGDWSGIKVQGCFLSDNGINDDVITEQDSEEIMFFVKNMVFEIQFSLS